MREMLEELQDQEGGISKDKIIMKLLHPLFFFLLITLNCLFANDQQLFRKEQTTESELFKKNLPKESALKQGEGLYKQGMLDQAITYATRAILLDNSDPRGYFLRGKINLEQVLYDDAIENFSKASSLEKNPLFLYHLAISQLATKDFQEAFENLVNVFTDSPHFVRDNPHLMGYIYGTNKIIREITSPIYESKTDKYARRSLENFAQGNVKKAFKNIEMAISEQDSLNTHSSNSLNLNLILVKNELLELWEKVDPESSPLRKKRSPCLHFFSKYLR